jgi:hypothetical protein
MLLLYSFLSWNLLDHFLQQEVEGQNERRLVSRFLCRMATTKTDTSLDAPEPLTYMCMSALDGLRVLCNSLAGPETLLPTSSKLPRHDSIPRNMYSQIEKRRWEFLEPPTAIMQGHCVIKSSPNEHKEMQVLMTVENGELTMKLEQQNGGRWHSFQLCVLSVQHLVISYSKSNKSNKRGFFIAAPWKGILEGSIYCHPVDNRIHWLLLLQKTGACIRLIDDQQHGSPKLYSVTEASEQTSSSSSL